MVNTLKHKDKYQQKEYINLAFPEKKKEFIDTRPNRTAYHLWIVKFK